MALSATHHPHPAGPPRSTVLRLTGPDALGLLHRVSTQTLEDLEPGRCRAALFCDYRGRLLHRALVGRTSDGAVWVVRDDAPSADLAAFLAGLVFRDRLEIEDRGETMHARFESVEAGGRAGVVIEREAIPERMVLGDGALVVLSTGASPPSGVDERAERQRIRSGRPRHGHEIAPDFTPFEVGLAHEVHLDKGCFTGQEALMRLVTYRGVRRRLALIEGEGSLPAAGTRLVTQATPAGVITSAVGEGDGWLALAVLPHAATEPGAVLLSPGSERIQKVAAFPETSPLGLPK